MARRAAPPVNPIDVPPCPSCGYDLTGLPQRGRCPECGEPFDQARLTRRVQADPDTRRRQRRARQIRTASLAALAVVLVGIGLGALASDPQAIVAGGAAVGLGAVTGLGAYGSYRYHGPG